MDPVVRPAVGDDEPAVHALAADLATSFVVERASFRRSFAEVLASDTATLLVAETSGTVGGYVLGFVHPAFYANGRVAWVEEITVAPALRRHGIGRLLMDAFEDRARAAGTRVVALATRRAGSFYWAIGYDESAVYFRKSL